MTSVKITFRPSAFKEEEGTLCFRLVLGRRIRRIGTGYRLFLWEWDECLQSVVFRPQSDDERKNYLTVLQSRIGADARRLNRIIASFERERRSYTYEDILAAWRASKGDSLFDFMEEMIDRFKRQGRMRTSETYAAALRSFARFRNRRDIRLEEIDSDTMTAYEAYLRRTGASRNTSSFYMRILRAAYNRAVERGIVSQKQPFRHVYTGVDKTVKRAMPLDALRRLKNADLRSFPRLDYARDMFLLSFYTRGMSFVDMAYLKKDDLSSGTLTYCRKKTGQRLSIRWEGCMQEIVAKYPDRHPAYLLPIIRKDGGDERRQYKNRGQLINRYLKKIGREMGFSVPLTMYVARHTWANIARSKNVPLAVISESMGHDSETTTRIYLASLDSAAVDRANRVVINSLFEDPEV